MALARVRAAERAGRLYGRGTADDKGGVMAHVAAVGSYLRAAKTLPLNVKFIVEGEEEIGSMNLGRFLAQYRAKMAADFIVLTDTRNYDVGHPALAYQLRGICQVDVEVQGLRQPLHSGLSGPVPDPVQILCAMIADLRPRRRAQRARPLRQVARPQRQAARAHPQAAAVRGQVQEGLRHAPRRAPVGRGEYSLLERMWTRPALTVIALEARPFRAPPTRSSRRRKHGSRSALSPAWTRARPGRLIVKKLTTRPPYGVKVTAKITGTTPWWTTDPEGPAFEAARGALKAGFGKETAMVGARAPSACQPFADLLKGAPCILMGVADPNTQAHLGEREPASRRLGEGDALDHSSLRRARIGAAAITTTR